MSAKPNVKNVLIALLFPLDSIAQDWRNPDATFSSELGFINKNIVTWLFVDNEQRTCEHERRKRGFGGFGYGVEACSFWTASTCTIVTSSRPTMYQLGHETRHCFQGCFH